MTREKSGFGPQPSGYPDSRRETTPHLQMTKPPAPLFEGEDAAGYNELLARVSGDMKPTDIVEEI